MDVSNNSYIFATILFFVPFISRLFGRLDSLATDFLGSSISLLISFADSFLKTEGKGNTAPIIFLILVTGVAVTYICYALNTAFKEVRHKKNIEEGKCGGLYQEALYWINVILSMVFLIFSFNINLAGSGVMEHKEDIMDFINYILFYNISNSHFFISTVVVIIVCVMTRYAYIVHKYCSK